MNHTILSRTALQKLIIKTFKQLESFSTENYTTDQLDAGIPEYELELLQSRFDEYMAAFRRIADLEINSEEDLMNWITITGYDYNGLENSITDYQNMC